MENFLKSIEIGETNKHCDSLMLRNAYSNMEYLFYGVQDYKNELVYAKKEYKLSKELNRLDLLPIIHVAMSYSNLDSTRQAKQYQYHLDSNKERQAEEVAVKYKTIIANISFGVLSVISLIIILTINRKNRNLKKLMSLSNEVKSTRERLNDVNHQLEKVENELKNKEDLLSEKIQQNSSILRLLNKSKLEEDAEEVVETIRQAAKGKKNLNVEEWKQLYAVVDKLYPEFRDQLIERLGNFSEKQMEVCYLMRIRLKNPEIQQLTGLSRATVWRWIKKFDWIK